MESPEMENDSGVEITEEQVTLQRRKLELARLRKETAEAEFAAWQAEEDLRASRHREELTRQLGSRAASREGSVVDFNFDCWRKLTKRGES